jgi:hypothetical protein
MHNLDCNEWLKLILLINYNVGVIFTNLTSLPVLVDLQSGCCKPPNSCNFIYVNPTNWTKPAGVNANADCDAWDNDPAVLCYSCESCKAGLLDNIKSNWKKVAVLNVIFLVFLIIVYSVGCCAFRNNRKDNAYWNRQ